MREAGSIEVASFPKVQDANSDNGAVEPNCSSEILLQCMSDMLQYVGTRAMVCLIMESTRKADPTSTNRPVCT